MPGPDVRRIHRFTTRRRKYCRASISLVLADTRSRCRRRWICGFFPTFAIANECCANYNPSLYTDSSLSCCSRICIDADLVMQTHVQRTVSRCFAVLRQLHQIRHSVPTDTSQTLVVSLVLTRLNYGNSFLAGLPVYLVRRLQLVLNASALLTYHLRRSDHISDALACLHWLRVPERIEFKIAVLTYKVIHGLAPGYLGPFTRVAGLPSRRSLRSVGTNRLLVPTSRLSTVGSRAFPVTGPQIWNDLPEDVTSA